MYSRRKFLFLAGSLFPMAKAAFTQAIKPKQTGIPPQLGTLYYIKKRWEGKNQAYSFTFYNLDTNDYFEIPLSFKAHSISLNSQYQQAFLSGKWLPQACTIDLKKRKIIQEISLNEGRTFNGHGLYLEKENLIMSSEQISLTGENALKDKYSGLITFRDPESLKVKREISSFGNRPHTLEFWDSQKNIIVVCNDDETQGNLAFINIQSGKLHKKIPTPQITPGHLALASSLLIYGGRWAPRLKTSDVPLGLYREGKTNTPEIIEIDLPFKTDHEVFWVTVNKQQTYLSFIITDEDIIYFFDLKNPKNKKYYRTNHPKGVVLSRGGEYFILFEKDRLRFFDGQTAEENTSMTRIGDFITGHPYLI